MGVVFSRKNRLPQKPSTFHISTNFSDEENLVALKNFALGSLSKHNKEKEILLSPNAPKPRSQSETKHKKFSPLRNPESVHPNKSFRNLHTKNFFPENVESDTIIPEKKTLFDDLTENVRGFKLPPIIRNASQPVIRKPAESVHESTQNTFERLTLPKQKFNKVGRKTIEVDCGNTPPKAITPFKELQLIKTEKEMQENVGTKSPLRFSFRITQNNANSLFSPKRNPTGTNIALKNTEKSPITQTMETPLGTKSGPSVGRESKIKFVREFSKFYQDSPKEAYRRIYEKALKDKDNENIGNNVQFESKRDGKVILLKKKDVILRNNTAVKILTNNNRKNNFLEPEDQEI